MKFHCLICTAVTWITSFDVHGKFNNEENKQWNQESIFQHDTSKFRLVHFYNC